MNRQFAWKIALVVAVLALSLYGYFAYGIKLGLDLKGGTSFLLQMDLHDVDVAGRSQVIREATEIIRRRVDKFGVAEPIIQPVGNDRIMVQLPGLAEDKRLEARRTLERTAYLEFRLVHEKNDELVAQAATDPRFVPPVGYVKMVHRETREGRPREHVYFVKVKPELTGKSVQRAYVQYDEVGRPYVALNFDAEGAKIFARVTTANVRRQLAIVLDGELYSAPEIKEPITGGRAQITGSFTLAEAQQLANVLENPLEAPVKIVEERGVDPSLGHDSIRSGVRAAVIGAAAVVIFMVVYYLVAGLIAVLALVLNLIIILGVLSLFGFTLTLPGIAGIVLTIGMAVDASVLIYERIREERAAGKALAAAIAAGYQRAFLVIFDSNFTTIITAAILIWLGSGPVQGFGVTLTIGLLANLFAAVFVTRLIMDSLVRSGWLREVKMLHLIGQTNINFLGLRWLAFGLSWLLIAVGVAWFVHRGGLQIGRGEIYGIDFAGGERVTLTFAQRIDPDLIRRTLEGGKVTDAYIQYARGGGAETLDLKVPEGEGERVISLLQQGHPNAQFKVIGTERVGGVIGAELLKQALIAVAMAMLAIMVYIAFRFGEFAYGVGALVALAHDVLMCIAWFCLTGRTFSVPVVAALLTVIGYSINDTIIIFDRIRENRKLRSGKLDYLSLINDSINQTLPRTILTAGTTLLTALSLYLFGGRVINDFAFCFLIGVLTGTYSSIYIASPIVLWWHGETVAKPART